MLTTQTEVLTLTGYDVTVEDIAIAQGIIEAFVGKVEADMDNTSDKAIVARAVVYQAAYMAVASVDVFSQMGVTRISNPDSSAQFDKDSASPFIAPLAALALKRLSWAGSKSVKTGPVFDAPVEEPWEVI